MGGRDCLVGNCICDGDEDGEYRRADQEPSETRDLLLLTPPTRAHGVFVHTMKLVIMKVSSFGEHTPILDTLESKSLGCYNGVGEECDYLIVAYRCTWEIPEKGETDRIETVATAL